MTYTCGVLARRVPYVHGNDAVGLDAPEPLPGIEAVDSRVDDEARQIEENAAAGVLAEAIEEVRFRDGSADGEGRGNVLEEQAPAAPRHDLSGMLDEERQAPAE